MKKSPLHKFTVQDWDCFFEKYLLCYATDCTRLGCNECPHDQQCLFCLAFDDDCEKCMPGKGLVACDHPEGILGAADAVDRGIARLYKEGVYKDEEK